MTKKIPTARVATMLGVAISLTASACGMPARVPVAQQTGPHPVIPRPSASLIPVMSIGTPKRWTADETPAAASDLSVKAFARDLDHPRSVFVLPNGDVLVAETNAPKRPDDAKGIKGFFFRFFQRRAGGGVPSENRLVLLRDANGDGVADVKTVFLKNLHSPFGMAIVGNDFYVANTDAIVRYPYTPGATTISSPGVKLVDLPGGRINHHWTKSIVASPDGSKLYASVGSNSNAAENGIAHENGRAAIWEIDRATGRHRVFASGLRNAAGLAWEPQTKRLWAAVNERDELGADLVPDYMTSIQDGGFYGWPYTYYGRHVDNRVEPQRLDLVDRAIVPDYALGSHTASLGLAWSGASAAMPERFRNGMFVGQHGSWNRKPFSGYRVLFVPFLEGHPSGPPIDVLTGFITPRGEAMGRPVGVAISKDGALLVADDVGNAVWRVTRRAQ